MKVDWFAWSKTFFSLICANELDCSADHTVMLWSSWVSLFPAGIGLVLEFLFSQWLKVEVIDSNWSERAKILKLRRRSFKRFSVKNAHKWKVICIIGRTPFPWFSVILWFFGITFFTFVKVFYCCVLLAERNESYPVSPVIMQVTNIIKANII